MADVSQVNLDGGYVPVSATKKKNPIALGWYPCHIVDCTVATKTVKGKHRAKIYNPMLEVAPEAKNQTFTVKDISGNDIEVTGEDYIGKSFRSMGIFHFLNPQVGDDFEPNPSGNVGYMRFSEAIGIEMPKAIIEVDGIKQEVIKLTELSRDDLLGLPVMACLGESKPWKGRDGALRTSFEMKAYRQWKDSIKKEVLDDIPF